MSKEEPITMEGQVVKCLSNARFWVELENGYILKGAYISGRIRKNFIKIVNGDFVKVEMSPYDLSKGRIVFRGKETKPMKQSA